MYSTNFDLRLRKQKKAALNFAAFTKISHKKNNKKIIIENHNNNNKNKNKIKIGKKKILSILWLGVWV
jgi:hypothetical protein